MKAAIPVAAMVRIAPPEFEGDAAKNQPHEHRDHGRIGCRQNDGIGERKRGEQHSAAEHQPGLVAVPYRRNRVHGLIPLGAHGKRREEDADTEIEAVHHDVGEYRERNDEDPNDTKVGAVAHAHSSGFAAAGLNRGCQRNAGCTLRNVAAARPRMRRASRRIIRSNRRRQSRRR